VKEKKINLNQGPQIGCLRWGARFRNEENQRWILPSSSLRDEDEVGWEGGQASESRRNPPGEAQFDVEVQGRKVEFT
jgi:hypothetical protein